MKTNLVVAILVLLSIRPAFAQSRDTELRVERRTLDRQDKLSRPRQNASELTRGLHITVKNAGFAPAAEGEVEWAVLVTRPGTQKALFDSGKEKLQALKAAEVATFNVGAISVQDIGNRQQDMEYQVIVRRAGAEVAKIQSDSHFDQQAASARGADKKNRKKGK